MNDNLPNQDKTLWAVPSYDINYLDFDYLLTLRTKLKAIDQQQHTHAVILEKFVDFDEDGNGQDSEPYGDVVYPVSATGDYRTTPTVNGWKCHHIDMLLDQVNDALLSKQRHDLADLFANTFPNLLKDIKQGKRFKGEFDTEEFIADFIAPMEAKIKAIREQQANIAPNYGAAK